MGYLTVQRNLNYINLKDYCKIDGSSDDSVGFTTAYQLASSLGIGLFHPGGTLIKGNDTLLSNVPIIGVGDGISIIKLKNGANTDLFSAQTGSINLAAAGNTGILGTLSRFQIKNLTLDGNKANQTGGPSYPLRFYGYDFRIENVEITGGYSGGYLSDWNYGSSIASPSDEMEAYINNVKIHDNNGIGFQFGGPHDTRIDNMLVFNNGSHNIHFAPNANGVLGTNIHPWGAPNVTGVCNWLIEIQFGCNFVNCISDGGYGVGVAILGTSVAWQGEIYTAHAVGVQLGQQAGQTPLPGQINQSAGLTTAVQVSGTMLNASINGCPATSIDVQNEVDSFILAYIFQTAGSAINGTLSSSDVYLIHVNGLTADGTVAKSGGMQFVSSANPAFKIYSNTGASLFHIDGSSGGTSGVDVPGAYHITATGGLGIGTSANSGIAALIAAGADAHNALVVYANSSSQSVPLLKVQNESFVDKFTVDRSGNMVVVGTAAHTGVITPSGGIAPVHTGFTSFATGGSANLLNATSGTSVTMVAGSVYWAALWIPFNCTLTGIICSIGTVGGTDLWIAALYDNAGNLLANSALAGTTAGSANTKSRMSFTGTVNVSGPSVFYIALQSNGTTAKFLAFNGGAEGFVTGSTTGTFGTLPGPLTPGTSYTVSVGPFATTY